MSARENAKLALQERWRGSVASLIDGAVPFGCTDKALKDYRGAPVSVLKSLQGKIFSETDFSYASFDNIWIEKCRFNCCRFDATSFVNVSEHENHFTDCAFDRADLSLAHLGILDLDVSGLQLWPVKNE